MGWNPVGFVKLHRYFQKYSSLAMKTNANGVYPEANCGSTLGNIISTSTRAISVSQGQSQLFRGRALEITFRVQHRFHCKYASSFLCASRLIS